MKSKIFGVVKYIFFLGLGVFIFWFIYRKYDFNEIIATFKEVNYFWIFISLVFSILSVVSRAFRWRLLIDSIGYKTRYINVFLSCYILYLVNLFVPRAGEVVRCAVVSSTEKVPFAKTFGTMIVERLADFIMLVILGIIIVSFNITTVKLFFNAHPEMTQRITSLLTMQNLIIVIVLMVIAISGFIYLLKRRRKNKVQKKESLWGKIREGVYSISKLKNKWAFIGHTIFIFLMWLLMLYVVFLAYKPTEHLSLRIGMVTFLMGGFAMLAPIPGGMGAWNFMVYQTLFIYGIALVDGEKFALIAFAATNLVYIILGAFALVVLFIVNSGKVQFSRKNI